MQLSEHQELVHSGVMPTRRERFAGRLDLEQSTPKRRRDESRSAAAARTGERGPPRRIGEERMGERDRVARPHTECAATREIVERSRDDREAHSVELPQESSDVSRQRTVDERLEEHRLRTVLTLVHRDELAEHRVRALPARSPAFDAADERLGSTTKRCVDQAFLRRRVEVHGARGDVGATRDIADT